MNFFDYWKLYFEIWIQLFIETMALRECHNQNRKRIELIERELNGKP